MTAANPPSDGVQDPTYHAGRLHALLECLDAELVAKGEG
jgi:hypothetical protein